MAPALGADEEGGASCIAVIKSWKEGRENVDGTGGYVINIVGSSIGARRDDEVAAEASAEAGACACGEGAVALRRGCEVTLSGSFVAYKVRWSGSRGVCSASVLIVTALPVVTRRLRPGGMIGI